VNPATNRRGCVTASLLLSVCLFSHTGSNRAAEASLPPYTPQSALSGTIMSVGSDTMVYVVAYWVVAFKRLHPGVQTRILQAGSNTAPPALLDGRANIGPMSRKMKDAEIEAFVKKYGYRPTEFRVAMDALAVYVNEANPVQGMTVPQVDAAFSSTRNCKHAEDVSAWRHLGLDGPWRDRPIQLFSRNTLSGTYVFFSEHALCKGKFKSTIAMQPTSYDVVRMVGENTGAIGYSGIGYSTLKKVRALPLAESEGQPYVVPTPENVYSGKYPLSRYLYIYVNKAPRKPLEPIEREFLRLALSAEGQSLVKVNGFIPLSPSVQREELAKLD